MRYVCLPSGTRRGLSACLVLIALLSGCGPAGGSSPAASVTRLVDPAAAASSLADRLLSPDATYHLDASLQVESDGVVATTEGGFDVVGNDAAGTFRVKAGEEDRSFELVLLGDFGWARMPGGEWLRMPRDLISTTSVDLTTGLRFLEDPSALRYEGVALLDGHPAHLFVNARPLPYDPGSTASVHDRTAELVRLEAYVTEDGVPIVFEFEFKGTGRRADGSQFTASGSGTYRFSRVGADIRIEAPEG